MMIGNTTRMHHSQFEVLGEDSDSEGESLSEEELPDVVMVTMQGPRSTRGQLSARAQANHENALQGMSSDNDEFEAAVLDEDLSGDMSLDTDDSELVVASSEDGANSEDFTDSSQGQDSTERDSTSESPERSESEDIPG